MEESVDSTVKAALARCFAAIVCVGVFWPWTGLYCDCVILAMDGLYSLIVNQCLFWPWIRPYHSLRASRRFVFGITA